MRAKQFLSELSNELLARYKKAASADASKADKEGDYERGNKRFKGINKATIKQFDNDAKSHKLDEKSTTEKQARFMAAAAHDPQFAARAGIKQSVAKEFNKADTGTKQLSNAMKHKTKKKKPLKEMDSQQPSGRLKSDGTRSHSTYGSRDNDNASNGPDIHLGPKHIMKKKDVVKAGSKALDKAFNNKVQDRKTGRMYDPDEEFNKVMNSPEVMAQMKRMATKEGVAETMSMRDAAKVLRHYGADHFKTTSNELHFYKDGKPLSVDLIWGNNGERSVSLSSLNSATRKLKGQGVAEGFDDIVKGAKRIVKGKQTKGERETHHASRGVAAAQLASQTTDPTEKDYFEKEMSKQINRFNKVKNVSNKGVAEGEVVAFPKKHKGDLADTHDCPKCGGDLQGGKYMGHAVKVCMPCKQVYLPPNSGIDKHGNKKTDEAQSMGGALTNALSKVEPGSKLDKKIKHHNDMVRRFGSEAGTITSAPDGYHIDKKGVVRLGSGKIDEIAGAFPSPSTRAQWAKDAAASNAAEARRQAELQRQANAAQASKLAANTAIVDRQNKINYHGANAPKPSNATWDGDSDFLDLDGTKYNKASRMPIPGGEAPDMKLIATQEGWQVYIWTRNSLKGVVGRYFYPADPIKEAMKEIGDWLAEEGKASRALCQGGKPDNELGASQLASCKSQGLRARDGEKSHLIGHAGSKVRIKVGGKKIKGKKYGGPLPDYGTRKGQV